MTLIELVVFLIIAGIVGSIAEFVVGFGRGGFLVAIIVGLAGALIGTWLAHQFHLPVILPIRVGTQTIEVVWSILGSLVLVAFLSLLRGPGRWRRGYGRRRY